MECDWRNCVAAATCALHGGVFCDVHSWKISALRSTLHHAKISGNVLEESRLRDLELRVRKATDEGHRFYAAHTRSIAFFELSKRFQEAAAQYSREIPVFTCVGCQVGAVDVVFDCCKRRLACSLCATQFRGGTCPCCLSPKIKFKSIWRLDAKHMRRREKRKSQKEKRETLQTQIP